MKSVDLAFTAGAFGDVRYSEQQKVLKESILKIYPDANLFFYDNVLPKSSIPFNRSMYGFKVWCVQACIDAGFKKVVFFDDAMILHDKMDYYEELGKQYGVLAVQDDNILLPFTNTKTKDYFKIEDSWFEGKHLVGGSFYYFDFETELCKRIFEDWKFAEINGIFGSGLEDIDVGAPRGHRSDETCMAISIYKNGSTPLPYKGSKYNWDENPIMTKKHFK